MYKIDLYLNCTTLHYSYSDASEVQDTVLKADQYIGDFVHELELKGLLSSTDIILVSDHGMTKTPTENVYHISDVVDTDKIERAVETLAFMFIKVRGVMNLAKDLVNSGIWGCL